MKTVEVDRAIGNVKGLMESLKAKGFAVQNVGASKGKTIIWMADSEKKDPTSFVKSWGPQGAPKAAVKEVEKVAAATEVKSVPKVDPAFEVPLKPVKPAEKPKKKEGFLSKVKGFFSKPEKAPAEAPWWEKKK